MMEVLLPYEPRRAFMPFHDRSQRWACLIAHRRAGKTVAAVNDILRAGITYQGPNGLFGYVAPFLNQARRIAWDYFKYFGAPLIADANESQMTLTLKNKVKVSLFGADNADSMRGLGFSGVYLDEYGDFKPSRVRQCHPSRPVGQTRVGGVCRYAQGQECILGGVSDRATITR
jgi:phage terminase large subunit